MENKILSALLAGAAMLAALSLPVRAAPGFSDSTSITSRIVAPSYCPNINFQWLKDGSDARTHPNIIESYGVGVKKAPDGNCYPIVNCQAGQSETFTAGVGYSCEWTSCPTAAPPNETRTLSCPSGMSGAITQSRSYSCSPPNWFAGAWTTTSNTCASAPTYTCADGSVVSDPSLCTGSPPPPNPPPPLVSDPPPTPPTRDPTPPSVSGWFAPAAVDVGQAYSVNWYATNATSLTMSCSGAAPGAYSVAPPSGTSSGTATDGIVGTTTCTLTASGQGGNVTSAPFSLTVRPRDPNPDFCPNVPDVQTGPGNWPSLWGETYTTDGNYALWQGVCGTLQEVSLQPPPDAAYLSYPMCPSGWLTFFPYGVTVASVLYSGLTPSGDAERLWWNYTATLRYSDGTSATYPLQCYGSGAPPGAN